MPSETTSKIVSKACVGLKNSHRVDRSYTKVRVPKMADDYGIWLVDLVADQENVLLKKREDFLKHQRKIDRKRKRDKKKEDKRKNEEKKKRKEAKHDKNKQADKEKKDKKKKDSKETKDKKRKLNGDKDDQRKSMKKNYEFEGLED